MNLLAGIKPETKEHRFSNKNYHSLDSNENSCYHDGGYT
jgi:hypothetical protein